MTPDTEFREPKYTPTPAEIRAACLKLQEGWSDAERIRRAGRSAHWGSEVEARQVRYLESNGDSE